MFSFIKWISSLFERLKRNKGLWFTTLTIVSLIGIFASMYFVNFLVSDVAKKTYENQKKHFNLQIKNYIATQNEEVLAINSAITKNGLVISLFNSEDQNKTQKIVKTSQIIASSINSSTATNYYNVKFEISDKANTFKPKSGLKIEGDRLYFTSTMKMSESNSSRLTSTTYKDAKSLIDIFGKENLEIAYLLNDGSISQVSLKSRKKDYIRLNEGLYLNKILFDSSFVTHLKKIDIKELLKQGYAKDDAFFYVNQKIYDSVGNPMGVVVIGAHTSEKNSFVNLIKNLVNSVTIVALGLIVSMILFLF